MLTLFITVGQRDDASSVRMCLTYNTCVFSVPLTTLCGLCRNWWTKYHLVIKCHARNNSPSAFQGFTTRGRGGKLAPVQLCNHHVFTLKILQLMKKLWNPINEICRAFFWAVDTVHLEFFFVQDQGGNVKLKILTVHAGLWDCVAKTLLFIVCYWFLWSLLSVQQMKTPPRKMKLL